MVKIREVDLQKLNSLTKYPSIPTYHVMGDRGRMTEEVQVEFPETIVITEKIDGVNSRIVFLPDGNYLIGSRAEWLYARGDLIGNPALNLAETLKPVAESLAAEFSGENPAFTKKHIVAYYFEVFGGKVTNQSKQYTSKHEMSYRLFDVCSLRPTQHQNVLSKDLEDIALWRKHHGQSFLEEEQLVSVAKKCNLPLVPRERWSGKIPTSIKSTLTVFEDLFPYTKCALDKNAGRRPEGVVIRGTDRSATEMDRQAVAKVHFKRYLKTVGYQEIKKEKERKE